MAFSSAEYVISAAGKVQWPNDDLPEVLIVGKSNVGKSSFLNTIFNNKRLAYTGKTPGKTRLLNFFRCKELMFVDSPGYGYANRSVSELNAYQRMMEEYLYNRHRLKLIIWLLDIRRIPNKDDLVMHKWLKNSHHPYLLVLNKADKLSNNQKHKQLKEIENTLNLDKDSFILFSAQTGEGKENLIKKVEDGLISEN